MWCECGHSFDGTAVPEGFADDRAARSGVCEYCGAGDRCAHVSYEWNIGVLLFRLRGRTAGNLCRTCAESALWRTTAINLTLGWWGVLSFFLTPVLLLTNFSAHAARAFGPEPLRSREHLMWAAAGAGGTLLVAVALYELWLADAVASGTFHAGHYLCGMFPLALVLGGAASLVVAARRV